MLSNYVIFSTIQNNIFLCRLYKKYEKTSKLWLNELILLKSRPRWSNGHHGDFQTDFTNKNNNIGGELKWRSDSNMADITVTEVKDPRLDFLQDYTLRSLRLKPDKWQRMIVSNEQMAFITGFVENGYPQVSLQYTTVFYLLLISYCCTEGHIVINTTFIDLWNWTFLYFCYMLFEVFSTLERAIEYYYIILCHWYTTFFLCPFNASMKICNKNAIKLFRHSSQNITMNQNFLWTKLLSEHVLKSLKIMEYDHKNLE